MNFCSDLESRVVVRGSHLSQWTLSLWDAFCSLSHGQLALLGKLRQKVAKQGFGIVGRPCGVQSAAPELC